MRLLNWLSAVFFIGFIFTADTTAYALFEAGVDSYNIDFGFMNIGEVRELQEKGSYHNEINCRSDTGQAWYLKIQAVEPLTSGDDRIPYEDFKWAVIEVIDGDGVIYNKDMYNVFSDTPFLVYTSGPSDYTGAEVKVRFKYSLSIPRNQAAGNYRAVIRYTMTEVP